MNKIESAIPSEFGHDATLVPGAEARLKHLEQEHAPWVIVTSCTRALLLAWAAKFHFPVPEVTVTAEDVEAGKPDPACYRRAQERLGFLAVAKAEEGEGKAGEAGKAGKEGEAQEQQRTRAVVFEDSTSGVKAGKAAECTVVAVTTTTAAEKLYEAGADWVVKDFESVEVGRRTMKGWVVRLQDVLESAGKKMDA